jgi:HlyD family secretion protein
MGDTPPSRNDNGRTMVVAHSSWNSLALLLQPLVRMSRMTSLRTKWIALAGAIAAAGGATAWALHTTTEVDVATAGVSSGTIARRIFATGTLRATRTVDVGTQVSGIVDSLQADFNSIVRTGQVIARLDPSLYRAELVQAQAAVLQAQANLTQARAGLEGARTAQEDAQTKYTRAAELAHQSLITQSDLDAAAVALDEARAGVHSAEAEVNDAAAGVQQAAAGVSQAQVNIDHTIIQSPIDGIVLSRNVDVGQTVAAAVQAPVLFSIATDLTHLQVQLDVDQSDVGEMQVGRPVTFDVESYPDETFHGTVAQVRLQPIAEQSTPATTIASSTLAQTTTSVATVVSYAAMIDVVNPDERLRPGMTAEVVLSGIQHENAIRIPNNALSFRPSLDVLKALGQAEPSADDIPPVAGDAAARPREVWKYDGRRFTPVPIRVGFADDQSTELVKGQIRSGDVLVTRAALRTRSRFSTAP